jgi:hypothetical protein
MLVFPPTNLLRFIIVLLVDLSAFINQSYLHLCHPNTPRLSLHHFMFVILSEAKDLTHEAEILRCMYFIT